MKKFVIFLLIVASVLFSLGFITASTDKEKGEQILSGFTETMGTLQGISSFTRGVVMAIVDVKNTVTDWFQVAGDWLFGRDSSN